MLNLKFVNGLYFLPSVHWSRWICLSCFKIFFKSLTVDHSECAPLIAGTSLSLSNFQVFHIIACLDLLPPRDMITVFVSLLKCSIWRLQLMMWPGKTMNIAIFKLVALQFAVAATCGTAQCRITLRNRSTQLNWQYRKCSAGRHTKYRWCNYNMDAV